MYEDLPDNAFIFEFPVATIVQQLSSPRDGTMGATIGGPLWVNSRNRKCIPLFTDGDLATRYINDPHLPGPKRLLWLKNDLELYNYLVEIGKGGDIARVAFDPPVGTSQIRSTSIESLLVTLRPRIPREIREELEGKRSDDAAKAKIQAVDDSNVMERPNKKVTIEYRGGGDADGFIITSTDPHPGVRNYVEMTYMMTDGGELGRSMVGMSPKNVHALLRGAKFDIQQMSPQPHYLTIVDRLDEPNEVLLQMHYTAGRTEPPNKTDMSPPLGWANKAITNFVKARYTTFSLSSQMEFWIYEEIRNGCAVAVELSVIDEGYEVGKTPEDKCRKIADRLTEVWKKPTTYAVAGNIAYFRPQTAS